MAPTPTGRIPADERFPQSDARSAGAGGGSGGATGGGGASGFAANDQPRLPPDVALAYDSALGTQAQPPDFAQRWSAWGSGFGGTSTTDGDPKAGPANVTANDYGFAGGMDYRVTPDALIGFALAGGGTNWNLAQNLGSGRSEAFEAGLYGKTDIGPAYIAVALAFSNNWFTTNRIAPLGDQLTAKFQGQDYAARVEAGYRAAVLPMVGVTPYAAVQAQAFHTPSYSETDLSGAGFGLSYNAMNATDTRTELGARFDDLVIAGSMPLVVRARLAWAHDWVSNQSLDAVFQALPGASFVVNGAAVPANSALATAGAELHMTAELVAGGKIRRRVRSRRADLCRNRNAEIRVVRRFGASHSVRGKPDYLGVAIRCGRNLKARITA